MAKPFLAEPGTPRLSVKVTHCVGTLELNAEFHLTQPWTVLFGPSGSGKSTLLRTIAGLVQPNAGKIRLVLASDQPRWLGTTLVDTASDQFVSSRPGMIALAPQSKSLFPHWNVADNLTMRRGEHDAESAEILSLLHLDGLKNKRPSELSGGEAQRVNLARAMTWTTPGGLLLLDEPFTGMDIALRDEIIRDMQAWLVKRNVCVLSVTHDVAEAFQLDAEVIRISDGKVVAQGPVEMVLAEERERLLKQLRG